MLICWLVTQETTSFAGTLYFSRMAVEISSRSDNSFRNHFEPSAALTHTLIKEFGNTWLLLPQCPFSIPGIQDKQVKCFKHLTKFR